MSGTERCDEIIRLIDDVLAECELKPAAANIRPAPSGAGKAALVVSRS